MKSIVQCVPNISEGRDLDKIKEIVKPLENHQDFKLISVEPDYDYNRTVITLLGDPKAMIAPLVQFFKEAIEKIDMTKHKGEHPRMGAVDVVPFIPIAQIDIEACINYANMLANEVSQLLHVPVFLYADAATDPARESLPNIRKGEFEHMAEKLEDSAWKPDFGPSKMHPTFGVVAIGARKPLIAYNIDLSTSEEKPVKAIARAIRQSSGGFQFVQAGPAFLVQRNHMQVTMNILDYKKNPIYRIYETVKMEAERYQIKVTGSEVVGLIPKDTLMSSLKYYFAKDLIAFDEKMSFEDIVHYSQRYLGLRDFDCSKIIEANIEGI
jgi:glutamate formiminotransferase / 5-formyltetrahydrofolate cyclo-ligase